MTSVSVNVFTLTHQKTFNKSASKKNQKMNQKIWKMKKIKEKSESHVKKMLNHAKFDKIHKCPMSNVIINLKPP